MVVLLEADLISRLNLSYFFLLSVSLFFVVFFVFFEALVLTISLSFGNLVFRSCSAYLNKDIAFSMVSFICSASHETMADLIVVFNC